MQKIYKKKLDKRKHKKDYLKNLTLKFLRLYPCRMKNFKCIYFHVPQNLTVKERHDHAALTDTKPEALYFLIFRQKTRTGCC